MYPKISSIPKSEPLRDARKWTWNLKITQLKRKFHLPNHHFGYPCYFSGVYSQTPVGVTVFCSSDFVGVKIRKIRLFEEECAIFQDLGGALKKGWKGHFLRFFTQKNRTRFLSMIIWNFMYYDCLNWLLVYMYDIWYILVVLWNALIQVKS